MNDNNARDTRATRDASCASCELSLDCLAKISGARDDGRYQCYICGHRDAPMGVRMALWNELGVYLQDLPKNCALFDWPASAGACPTCAWHANTRPKLNKDWETAHQCLQEIAEGEGGGEKERLRYDFVAYSTDMVIPWKSARTPGTREVDVVFIERGGTTVAASLRNMEAVLQWAEAVARKEKHGRDVDVMNAQRVRTLITNAGTVPANPVPSIKWIAIYIPADGRAAATIPRLSGQLCTRDVIAEILRVRDFDQKARASGKKRRTT